MTSNLFLHFSHHVSGAHGDVLAARKEGHLWGSECLLTPALQALGEVCAGTYQRECTGDRGGLKTRILLMFTETEAGMTPQHTVGPWQQPAGPPTFPDPSTGKCRLTHFHLGPISLTGVARARFAAAGPPRALQGVSSIPCPQSPGASSTLRPPRAVPTHLLILPSAPRGNISGQVVHAGERGLNLLSSDVTSRPRIVTAQLCSRR